MNEKDFLLVLDRYFEIYASMDDKTYEMFKETFVFDPISDDEKLVKTKRRVGRPRNNK